MLIRPRSGGWPGRCLALAIAILAGTTTSWALGDDPLVAHEPSPGAFALVSSGQAAPLIVDNNDFPAVRRAVANLRADVARVSGLEPQLVSVPPSRGAADVVIVGTLGRSAPVDKLVAEGKLDAAAIRGRWEAFLLQVVENPAPGVERALAIVGSDRRGTVFGTYTLSEHIGVSPWFWWADVPVVRRDALFVPAATRRVDAPVVRYRGIFLNDEEPALGGWVRETFGGFNHGFYEKVFELILRLRGNFLWPAMWNSAFYDDDPLNGKLADEYGIVISTSHHEPMMRAHAEWQRHGSGPWNYDKNPEKLREFWTEGIRRARDYEKIITLGMRGDGDEPMSEEANVELLERIVADQRAIIAREQNPDLAAVPQVWALYKEVQEYYERGMRVPDDVLLLWCDDNWGNIRRLPTPEERARPGGAGVYYHFDYVGGPRSYKWLNVTPLPKIWEQMRLAWQYGADRLWIVNVGDLKPMEVPLEFFLTYAWDPARWPVERLGEYLPLWSAREFGPRDAEAIADIVARYAKYNRRRTPELLEPRTFSLVNYREAEHVVADWRALEARAGEIYARLQPEAKDAFYQLVLHPVKACAVVNDLLVTAGRNDIYSLQGRTSTNALAGRVRKLFREDAELTRYFHEDLAHGKWNHFMAQNHLGYTYWNQPVRNTMPAVKEVQPTSYAEMGIAVEGAERGWPHWGPVPPVLPTLSPFDETPRHFEIYNRGLEPFTFSITTSDPWLLVDRTAGEIGPDQRIHVSARWEDVPPGTTRGAVTVNGPGGATETVQVPISNPASPRPEAFDGFVETGGSVSIEAAHYSRAVAPQGRSWQVIPDHGRTLSGVTPLPVTGRIRAIEEDGMRLEYEMHLFTTGQVEVKVTLAPTQKFQPGDGFRFGVSVDDAEPQIINVHADTSLRAWERSVEQDAVFFSSQHDVDRPGSHVLKLWALDPGLVFEKIVVDTGGVRPSYLGPPESPHGGK